MLKLIADTFITVRVAAEEKEELKKQAAAQKTTISKLVRGLIAKGGKEND